MGRPKVVDPSPESIAAVQAVIGVEPPYPASKYAGLVLSTGLTVSEAAGVFLDFLNRFPGETMAERVYNAGLHEHDRGQEPAFAWRDMRPVQVEPGDGPGPGGRPATGALEAALAERGITVEQAADALAKLV